MAKLGDLGGFTNISGDFSSQNNNDDDIGIFRSTLSGIASGVFKIPEGFFSLGANLMDLGLGTNTAAGVEKFFDTINPFDEAAEATAAGRIAELIVNIGVPGGIAFKAGKNLAKTALAAKQNGKYFSMTGEGLADDVISKGIPKASKWNIAPINKEVQDFALTKQGKVLEYAAGAGLGGVAEGVFVGDVDEAGTLGDLLGGPTKLDKSKRGTNREKAARELSNRLKFGTEGGLFTGAFGVAGVGVNRLRKGPTDTGRVITDPMEKYWNDMFSGFSKRGKKGQTTFESREALRGALASEERLGLDAAKYMNKELESLYPGMQKYFASEDGLKELAKKKAALNETLTSGLDDVLEYGSEAKRLKPNSGTFYKKQLTKEGRDSGFTLDEILEGGVLKDKNGKILDQKTIDSFIEDGFSVKFKPLDEAALKPFYKELDNSKSYGEGAPIQAVKENIKLEMDFMRSKWGDLFSSYGRLLDNSELSNFKGAFKNKIKDYVDVGSRLFKNKTSGAVNTLDMIAPSRGIINQSVKEIQRAGDTYGITVSREEADKIVKEVYENATLEKGFDLDRDSGIFFRKLPKILGFTEDTLANAIDQGYKSTGRLSFRQKELTKNIRNLKNKEEGLNLSRIPEKEYMVDPSGKIVTDGTGVIRRGIKLPDGSIFERRKLLEDLVGKSKDGLNTVITGTNRIANLVRTNEVNNELIKNSVRQKKLVDEWLTSVDDIGEEATVAKMGARPKAPEIVDTAEEATKYFGGVQGQIATGADKSTGDFVRMEFQGNRNPIKGIKPVEEGVIRAPGSKLTNNLDGKFALTGNADAIVRGDIVRNSKLLDFTLYKNAILYPKAGAQLAKTVLGPVTHARNFLSAMAFAGANGVLLNNEFGALKKAWNSSMGPAFEGVPLIGGKSTPQSQAFYRKLLDLGVVNSNVSQGDLNRLLKDVNFGEFSSNLQNRTLNNIVNTMSRAKRFAEDAYTAEDDFWKIFSWLGEKARIEKSLDSMPGGNSLAKGEDVIQVLDDGTVKNLGKYNEEFLEKRAADLVKNNVPNYAYVSDFVKGLRQYPVGNFVSFPAEIMRTSTNIVETALDEINFTLRLNKKGADGKFITIKPFASIGKQRLRGMALTTAIVPASIATAAEMLYDVTKDEIEALRRYVPSWSKNSTLIPIRDKNGKLSYVDFSRMNAYDLLLKPFQAVINSVEAGRTDKNGIMGNFIQGVAEATKNIGAPFVESSLWTAALMDVLPTTIMGRGGLDENGRRLFNPNDNEGNKMMAKIMHLIKAVAPFNASQMNRLFKSAMPEGSAISYDKYGKDYKFGKELVGLLGLRPIEVDPQRAMKYKINEYQKNIRNSRSLFTGTLLRGGPISPEEVVDAYLNANRALFQSNNIMYKDMRAANILGMPDESIEAVMKERGAGTAYDYLSEGEFRPYVVSDAVEKVFQFNSNQTGLPNPLDQAKDVMDRIADTLELSSLSGNAFPDIQNPFKNTLTKMAGNIYNAVIPPQATSSNNFFNSANVSVPNTNLNFDKLPTNEKYKTIFPQG